MKIQILGTGCPKCKQMSEAANRAAVESGLEYELEKVTDINEIISFGVIMTPALVLNGEVKAVGKTPSVEEIKELLKNTKKDRTHES